MVVLQYTFVISFLYGIFKQEIYAINIQKILSIFMDVITTPCTKAVVKEQKMGFSTSLLTFIDKVLCSLLLWVHAVRIILSDGWSSSATIPKICKAAHEMLPIITISMKSSQELKLFFGIFIMFVLLVRFLNWYGVHWYPAKLVL